MSSKRRSGSPALFSNSTASASSKGGLADGRVTRSETEYSVSAALIFGSMVPL